MGEPVAADYSNIDPCNPHIYPPSSPFTFALWPISTLVLLDYSHPNMIKYHILSQGRSLVQGQPQTFFSQIPIESRVCTCSPISQEIQTCNKNVRVLPGVDFSEMLFFDDRAMNVRVTRSMKGGTSAAMGEPQSLRFECSTVPHMNHVFNRPTNQPAIQPNRSGEA